MAAFYLEASARTTMDLQLERDIVEMCQRLERPETTVHVRGSQTTETIQGEVLHRERRQHRSIDYRAAHLVGRRGLGAREVAHEAAREAVARAGGIDHVVEREGRRRKHAVLVEEQRAR